MLGDNLVIEPVEDVTVSKDDVVEKREPTKTLRHVVYKVQPKEESATVNDYGMLIVTFADFTRNTMFRSKDA